MRSIGTRTISGPASASSAADGQTVPAGTRGQEAAADDGGRGETYGARRGIPSAATSRVTERRRRPDAHVDGRMAAGGTGQIERNDEEKPGLREELEGDVAGGHT